MENLLFHFLFLEEKKEQDKQWKRMKLGFYFFGTSAAGFGIVSLYELAQVNNNSKMSLIIFVS